MEKIKINLFPATTNFLAKYAPYVKFSSYYNLVGGHVVSTIWKFAKDKEIKGEIIIEIRKPTVGECLDELEQKIAKGDLF